MVLIHLTLCGGTWVSRSSTACIYITVCYLLYCSLQYNTLCISCTKRCQSMHVLSYPNPPALQFDYLQVKQLYQMYCSYMWREMHVCVCVQKATQMDINVRLCTVVYTVICIMSIFVLSYCFILFWYQLKKFHSRWLTTLRRWPTSKNYHIFIFVIVIHVFTV